jgi:hypothetical protein
MQLTFLTPTIKIKWPCKSCIYEAIFISSTKSSTKIFLGFNKEDQSLMIHPKFLGQKMRKNAQVLFLFL